MLKIRSGIGYDVHRIEPGDGLLIGGVRVSDSLRFVAHSDGDVLLHALIDALLGAVGEADIGELYPDTEENTRNLSSATMLAEVAARVDERQFEIINVDSVIIAQVPRIVPFKQAIRERVATLLGIPAQDVNVKAKTKEHMDAAGRGECIECYCVVMVRSRL